MPTLNWIGKETVVKHHKDVPLRLLEPVPELSCGAAEGGNLIVQGDNLHALRALLPRYAGQVKCIYIDPPYNTGNEGWAYNDNVNSPEIRKWLGEVVGKEGETLDRHDRWLSMMYPRLALLKRFLRDDGAIFISIDDNEVATLRLLRLSVTFTSSSRNANASGGGRKSCTILTGPIGSSLYLIRFFIDPFALSPVAGADDADRAAPVGEADGQDASASRAEAVIARLRAAVRQVLRDDAARVAERELCFRERNPMLGAVRAVFRGVPLEAAPVHHTNVSAGTPAVHIKVWIDIWFYSPPRGRRGEAIPIFRRGG